MLNIRILVSVLAILAGLIAVPQPSAAQSVRVSSVAELTNQAGFTSADANVLRLYWAFFNRNPDLNGAKYWLGIARDGAGLDLIATQFAISREFQTTYGDTDNKRFLEIVYQNVLGRPADPGGFRYWLGLLDRGEISRGGTVRWVAAADEFIGRHRYPEMTRPGSGTNVTRAEVLQLFVPPELAPAHCPRELLYGRPFPAQTNLLLGISEPLLDDIDGDGIIDGVASYTCSGFEGTLPGGVLALYGSDRELVMNTNYIHSAEEELRRIFTGGVVTTLPPLPRGDGGVAVWQSIFRQSLDESVASSDNEFEYTDGVVESAVTFSRKGQTVEVVWPNTTDPWDVARTFVSLIERRAPEYSLVYTVLGVNPFRNSALYSGAEPYGGAGLEVQLDSFQCNSQPQILGRAVRLCTTDTNDGDDTSGIVVHVYLIEVSSKRWAVFLRDFDYFPYH
ncbi:MAG: DUF4214 domain-containing protein [Acidimicrobiia bacterium]|nr:DUF4214 domain-containing protein [Acidimicrobiia bacterium]